MNIAYIAETSLTNKSAYTHHVIKMCDAFSQECKHVTLFIPSYHKKIKFSNLKKNFLLSSKKKFLIRSVLNFKPKNFISRSFFAFKISKYLKSCDYDIILTRSFISSIFLSIFNINHYLEIHSELKSITKFLMINLNFINSKYIIKKILISKALNKIYKIKKNELLILHDAVDVKNFKKKIIEKKITRAAYVGSFYKGRGIEIIKELSKQFKNVKFYLYGQKNFLNVNSSNLKFFNYVEYKKVPKILSKAQLLLMPYAENVSVRAKNINTANYCSPLKMFDYLASGKIIMSSKLEGICEILKHKKNAIIVKKYKKEEWIKEFQKLINNKYDLKKISQNSIYTADKNTWNLRVLKIIKSYKHFYNKI